MSDENCPILKAKGIPFSNSAQGHEICESCPLYPGKCIYDVRVGRGKSRQQYILTLKKEVEDG